jgi:hypothetical protein
MDPVTIAAIAKAALPLLTSPRAPSQEQINAAIAAQQKAERQKWMIAGGIAAAGVLIYLVASRR